MISEGRSLENLYRIKATHTCRGQFITNEKNFFIARKNEKITIAVSPQHVFRGRSTWTHEQRKVQTRPHSIVHVQISVCMYMCTGDNLTVNLNHKIRFRLTSRGIICTKRQLIESVWDYQVEWRLHRCSGSSRIYAHVAKRSLVNDDLQAINETWASGESRRSGLTHDVASVIIQFRMILRIVAAFGCRRLSFLNTPCARSKIAEIDENHQIDGERSMRQQSTRKMHRSMLCTYPWWRA